MCSDWVGAELCILIINYSVVVVFLISKVSTKC